MEKKDRFLSIIIAFAFFIKLSPYFVWNFGDIYFEYGSSLLIAFIFILKMRKLNRKDKLLFISYILCAIVYGFTNGQNILAWVVILILGFIAFAKDQFNVRVYHSFIILYCVIIGLGVCSWFLVLLGVMQPIGFVNTISDDVAKQSGYIVYPFALVIQGADAIRFRGVFDEPGIVGTMSSILLCCNKFNFKDWKTYSLLLSGLLSLSFFFYIIVLVYLIVNSILINRRFSYLVLLVAIVLSAFYFTKDNEIIYDTLWSRFEWDSSSGKFVGDNRSGDTIDQYYKSIKGTRQFWLGTDSKAKIVYMLSESSSYKNVVLLYGMLFFFLYCLFFILFGFLHKKTFAQFFLYAFVFLGMIYQRPDIFNPLFIFLFSYFARRFSYQNVSVN